jgi:hypothetical protein
MMWTHMMRISSLPAQVCIGHTGLCQGMWSTPYELLRHALPSHDPTVWSLVSAMCLHACIHRLVTSMHPKLSTQRHAAFNVCFHAHHLVHELCCQLERVLVWRRRKIMG